MFGIKLAATGATSFVVATGIGALTVAGREVKRGGESLAQLELAVDSLRLAVGHAMPRVGFAEGRRNVETDFNEDVEAPRIDPTAFVDPLASVIGHVQVGRHVYLAPFASVRGDEGQPVYLGDRANVQDGVVIHALETSQEGRPVPNRTYRVGAEEYAVYVGKRVSLAHQALVHGPARIDDDVFVGMQAMVFKASVGEGAVIEPGARVIGVAIPPRRYVPAGQTVTDQSVADRLPQITAEYPFRGLNEAVVHVNTSLAAGYRAGPEDGRSAVADRRPIRPGPGAPGLSDRKTGGAKAAKQGH
jgi:carbonic anhydrase/acetyltransferase-like protein (isoleucine patch superfamily)